MKAVLKFVVVCVISYAVCQAVNYSVYLNVTESLPVGVYVRVPKIELYCGDYVVYEPSEEIKNLIRKNGWGNGEQKFLKQVVGVSGDEYEVDKKHQIFLINGKYAGQVLKTDSAGKKIPQLEGKDVPPEITVVNPREDFMFAKTLDEVLSKVIEAQKHKVQIDLVEIVKQAKQNAFNQVREQDAQKLQRIDAIKNIDIEAKPKNNLEKLQRFCKKSMEAHGEGYKGYVVDGVKRFLLATPNTKLENITKLIDAVAPAAVFNTKNYSYSDFVKSAVREDKNFATKLAEIKKSRSTFSR